MMRRRRPAVLILAAVLLLGAACSSGGGTTADTPAPAGTTTAPAGSPGPPDSGGAATGAAPKALAASDDLYARAASVPADELDRPHGTLLAYQPVDPSPLPAARTYRILYVSAAADDHPVPVTGTVAVPDAAPPADGRVVLTIAHGTSGSADRCAPSRAKDLASSELPLGLMHGWIVAESDYQGMGTPGPHPYLVGPSEGRNVIDAALAAAQLPDADAGSRLAIAGYSQGGHGALWAAQVAPTWAPDLDVVGTFAGAPATELDVILAALPVVPASGAFGLLMVEGFREAYGLDPTEVLTPAGLDVLAMVDDDVCVPAIAAKAATTPDLFRRDVPRTGEWFERVAESNPGQVELGAPVLIIHSDQDRTVPVVLSETLFDRMCKVGTVAERRVLVGGGDHGKAATTAFPQAMTWLQERVDGQPPVDGCASASP